MVAFLPWRGPYILAFAIIILVRFDIYFSQGVQVQACRLQLGVSVRERPKEA